MRLLDALLKLWILMCTMILLLLVRALVLVHCRVRSGAPQCCGLLAAGGQALLAREKRNCLLHVSTVAWGRQR